MGDTIKDFLDRNRGFFEPLADKLTVCVRPEGIADREPDEMWQGLLKNMPEELYELEVIMFNLKKVNDVMVLEVSEDDLKVALERLDRFVPPECPTGLPFSDETEVK